MKFEQLCGPLSASLFPFTIIMVVWTEKQQNFKYCCLMGWWIAFQKWIDFLKNNLKDMETSEASGGSYLLPVSSII